MLRHMQDTFLYGGIKQSFHCMVELETMVQNIIPMGSGYLFGDNDAHFDADYSLCRAGKKPERYYGSYTIISGVFIL